jgi:hypothetical protein
MSSPSRARTARYRNENNIPRSSQPRRRNDPDTSNGTLHGAAPKHRLYTPMDLRTPRVCAPHRPSSFDTSSLTRAAPDDATATSPTRGSVARYATAANRSARSNSSPAGSPHARDRYHFGAYGCGLPKHDSVAAHTYRTRPPEFANPTRCTLTHRMSRSRRFHWAAAEELLLRMFSILGAGCEADAWPVPCYEHCLTNDTTRETDPSAARRSRDPSALSHTALARGRCDEGGRRLQ